MYVSSRLASHHTLFPSIFQVSVALVTLVLRANFRKKIESRQDSLSLRNSRYVFDSISDYVREADLESNDFFFHGTIRCYTFFKTNFGSNEVLHYLLARFLIEKERRPFA